MSTHPQMRFGLAEVRRAIFGSLCALGIAACTSASYAPSRSLAATPQALPPMTANSSSSAAPASDSPGISDAATRILPYNTDAAIAKLWKERQHDGSGDFPLGPGDLINLSCPDDDEFNGQYRISGQGTFTLPLVGEVKAAGLTQDELKAELEQRLKHYLRNPQINLLVGEYRSRQVGVFGAVAKPGVYDLSGPHDTIQDMISQAGGYMTDASPRVEFKPAPPPTEGRAAPITDPSALTPISNNDLQNAIVVNVDNTEGRSFLGLPARPGDVINVTADGQVLVDGWVSKPGSYQITRDLKVLGAVAAAGGALFPAKTDSVQIVRKDSDGQQIILVDLEKVRTGDAADIPVEDGDVIEVPISDAKAVPYGLYEAAMTMIRFGSYVTP